MRMLGLLLLLSAGLAAQDMAVIHVLANPVSAPPVSDATILIKDGLITAVGQDVDIPAGTRVIDATGLSAWPGFIDCWSDIGLTEIGQVTASVDTRELGDWQAHLRTASAINPHSAHIPVARVNGITTAASFPSSGTISGLGVVLDLFGRTVTGMQQSGSHPLRVLRLPRPPSRTFSSKDEKGWQEKLEKGWKKLEKRLERARDLAPALASGVSDYARDLGEQERLSLAAEARHLAGGHPFLVRVDGRDQILAALAFAKKHDLKLVLAGLRDAWQVVDRIKGTPHHLVLGSVFAVPDRDDPYDAAYTTAAVLHRAGLRFGFMSGSSSGVRNLPYMAAMAASFGLPREAALRALTLGGAEALGIDGTHGSLYPGKLANIVLYRSDPLDARVSPERVIIHGHDIPLNSRHTRLARPFLNK